MRSEGRYRDSSRAVVAIMMVTVLAGCASVGPARSPKIEPAREMKAQRGWWYAAFSLEWPRENDPRWHLDLLLAHQVVAPVLAQYRDEIILWRFHRRAARDRAGHRFSFIFYSSAETASRIFDSLSSAPLLQEMKIAGLVVQDGYDDTGRIIRPGIEDTSDRSWSAPVQKSWPFFIMGVSEMWLSLITEFAEHIPEARGTSSIGDMLAIYEEIDRSVKASWRDEGRHALLHHLNALFGYEPLVVYEKRLLSF